MPKSQQEKINWSELSTADQTLIRLCKKMHKNIKKQSQKWEFKRWKVTAKLLTPLYAPDSIYLDGLIYHEMLRYNLGSWYYNLSSSQEINLQNLQLPIQQSKKYGVYLASYGNYTGNTFVSKFRKRLDEVPAVDWCKAPKGLMRTNMGKYKNIDAPMVLNNCREVSWIVISDKDFLIKLLQNVQSIGKKKAQGMGIIESWIIEPTAQNYKGTRCFPVLDTGYKVDGFGRVNPSYHDCKGQQEWFYKQF